MTTLDGTHRHDHDGHVKNTASVAQLKARLSEYLRRVKGGTELLITERGLPIARLSPLDSEQRRTTRRERLVRAGILRRGTGKIRKSLLSAPQGDTRIGRDILNALLDERGKEL